MQFGPLRLLRLAQLGLREELLSSADLWRCLGCQLCQMRCPNGVDVGRLMETLKEEAWEWYREQPPGEEVAPGLEALQGLTDRLSAQRNISGDDNSLRLVWSQNLESLPSGLLETRKAETVYFVGCVASFFPMSYRLPQTLSQLLSLAGMDFTALGGQEWCCGYPLRAAGRTDEAEVLARNDIDQVLELGAKRLVTTCPSCFYVWRTMYPEVWGGELPLEVLHSTQLLEELVSEGELKPGRFEVATTYHDPCDLGRKGGVYDAPRRVLTAIPGLELREMEMNHEHAFCCGGGGNVESFDGELTADIAFHRVGQARRTGARVLVSACQQCERTLVRAARRERVPRGERMRVMDVAEVLWASLEGKDQ